LNLAAVVELQLHPEQSVSIMSRQDMTNVVVAALTAIVHKMVIECYKRSNLYYYIELSRLLDVINKILRSIGDFGFSKKKVSSSEEQKIDPFPS
jgi:hypothetical protein